MLTAPARLRDPPIWPRAYAADILALPTRAQRTAALAAVPDAWRPWVTELVRDTFAKRQHRP